MPKPIHLLGVDFGNRVVKVDARSCELRNIINDVLQHHRYNYVSFKGGFLFGDTDTVVPSSPDA